MNAPPTPPQRTRRIEIPFASSTGCLIVPASHPRPGERPPLFIALHGQGQSGERQMRWLDGVAPPHVAAAFPDGFHKHEIRKDDRPVRVGHAWYMFTGDQEAFAASLVQSEAGLWALADHAALALGADSRRLWLCGFSQGAYLAHCAAVRATDRVAGWIAQSGRLKHEFLGDELPGVAGKPVLVQHGRHDPHLALEVAEKSAAILSDNGADVTLRLYEAGHEITNEMVLDARTWLDEHA